MIKKLKLCCALAVLGFVAIAGIQIAPVLAEPAPPIKRTLLQKFDVPGTNFETVIGVAEIVPNVNIGKHTKVLATYVVEKGKPLASPAP